VCVCRGFVRVLAVCDPLFGLKPTCYPYGAPLEIIDDAQCADQWTIHYNVSQSTIVQQLAEVNNQAHTACSAIKTKVGNPLPSHLHFASHVCPTLVLRVFGTRVLRSWLE
jgi:hypothetical protein